MFQSKNFFKNHLFDLRYKMESNNNDPQYTNSEYQTVIKLKLKTLIAR